MESARGGVEDLGGGAAVFEAAGGFGFSFDRGDGAGDGLYGPGEQLEADPVGASGDVSVRGKEMYHGLTRINTDGVGAGATGGGSMLEAMAMVWIPNGMVMGAISLGSVNAVVAIGVGLL